MWNRVRSLRRDRRWTQAELGEALGVSRQTIIAIENGKYDPSLRLAFAIASVFELRVDEVFNPDGDGAAGAAALIAARILSDHEWVHGSLGDGRCSTAGLAWLGELRPRTSSSCLEIRGRGDDDGDMSWETDGEEPSSGRDRDHGFRV